MKHLNSTIMIITLALSSHSAFAVTIANDANAERTISSEVSNERTIRGKLIVRHADGKIETSQGSFSTRSAEVTDHRPIDDWYKTPTDAEVSLYFEGERLTRVVIY